MALDLNVKYSDPADSYNVRTVNYGNMSIPVDWKNEGATGHNEVFNDTETRELHWIVSGINKTYPMDH